MGAIEIRNSQVGRTLALHMEIILKEKRIRDYDDFEEVKKNLKYIFVLIGLKPANFPTDLEKVVLFNSIKENLGQYSPNELKLAFELAVNNKLNIEDIGHYQNFSYMYLSKIMNAYNGYRFKLIKESLDQKNRIDSKKKLNEDEKRDISREFFENVIIKMLLNYWSEGFIEFKFHSIDFIFKYLEKVGYISISKDEKNSIFQQISDYELSPNTEIDVSDITFEKDMKINKTKSRIYIIEKTFDEFKKRFNTEQELIKNHNEILQRASENTK